MSSIDIISMSLRNLFKRKLRTFLTILGVIIGTAAIIVMVSLGLAINQGFEESMADMGDIRVLTVRNPNGGSSGGRVVMVSGGGMVSSSGGSSGGGTGTKIELNEKALNGFKDIPHVYAATPVVSIEMTAKSGKFVTWIQIKGIDPDTMEDFDYKLKEGELLKGDKNGIVFGAELPYDFRDPNDRNYWRNYDWNNRSVAFDLFNDKIEMSYEDGYGYESNNPIYQDNSSEDNKQKPKPYKLKVNGWLDSMGWENDYYAFMDINEVLKIKLAQQRYRQNEGIRYGNNSFSSSEYDSVLVKCDDIDNVEDVKEAIEEMGFYVDSYYIDYINQMKEFAMSLQVFLGAIGAVSLFVAAIGIANTMIMSIYERTREIGIMKVIGASIKDIKKLFLLEATFIGLIGGAAGILLSLGISYLLNTTGINLAGMMGGGMGMGSKVSVIPMWLCGLSLAFSSLIGLVSGYFPARRAMNLSALAAIRTE